MLASVIGEAHRLGGVARGARTRRGADRRDRPSVLLLFALLALLWQSLSGPLHHAADPAPCGPAAGAPSGPATLRAVEHRSRHDAATCPICQTLAQAGHGLLPAPAIIGAMLAEALPPARPAARITHLRLRSHAWRGRAPPSRT